MFDYLKYVWNNFKSLVFVDVVLSMINLAFFIFTPKHSIIHIINIIIITLIYIFITYFAYRKYIVYEAKRCLSSSSRRFSGTDQDPTIYPPPPGGR